MGTRTRTTTLAMTCAATIACAVGASGCGGGSERYIPSTEGARAAVEAALGAWKAGVPPGPVEGTEPSVQVVDSYRKPGESLAAFEVLGEVPGDVPRCFAVELRFEPHRVEKARYVVVGIDPLWVFRMEDYQLLAHWEHHMEETRPDAGGQKAPSGQERSGER